MGTSGDALSLMTTMVGLFSRASDEWSTPSELWKVLHQEFGFTLDGAATKENATCVKFFDRQVDALTVSWQNEVVWLNPPYSKCRAFMAKARKESKNGATVVCLVPSRTDTRWWHESVWDTVRQTPQPNVEVRFIKGRLKFKGPTTGTAPFPSVLVIFRPNL
jgi:phage N-6-adenine-methyltransferase